MASIVTSPTYPIPGETAALTFSGLATGTNFVEVFAVSAPEGSDVQGRVDGEKQGRVLVHSGKSSDTWRFTPDKGGVYTFAIQETSVTSASLAMFQDDPRGAPSPTVTATSTATLRVGQRMKVQLGIGRNTADFEVFVWDATIRPTTKEQHGIVTPAIRNPQSPAAKAAIEAANVVSAVAAMSNITAATAVGSISSVFASLRDAFQNHASDSTAHNASDDWNTLSDSWVATSPKKAADSINELRRLLIAHAANAVDPTEESPTEPHDGVTMPEFVSFGASPEPRDLMIALVDLWMAYSDHIARGAPVHNSADVTNLAPTLSPLMTLHRRFLEALASTAPQAPADTNSAATTLAQLAGFSEA